MVPPAPKLADPGHLCDAGTGMDMSSDHCHRQKHKVGGEGPAWENKRLFQVSTHCRQAGGGGWAQLESPLCPFFPFLGSITLGNSLSLFPHRGKVQTPPAYVS